MKKKLLTILISVFVALGYFTYNVKADINDAQVFFETYGTNFLSSPNYKFTNGNAELYIANDGTGNYFAFDYNSTSEYDVSANYLEIITVSNPSTDVFFAQNSSYNFTPDSLSYTFTISEGNIVSIAVSGSSTNDLNGTYALPVTIGDIIPADFPKWITDGVYEPGWTNGNEELIKSGDNINMYGTALNVPLTTPLTPDGNGNYSCTYLIVTITFNMNGNTLTSIVVNGSNIPTDNGTYLPPAPQTKISDILPDDFPQSIQAGLINENGIRAYKEVPMSSLIVGTVSLGLNNAVTKVGNDYSYTYGMSPNQTYLFKITNGKVSSIVVSGCSDSIEDWTYSVFRITELISSYNVGYSGEVKIRLNAYYPDTLGTKVYVDGDEKIEGTDYDREPGSLIITFKSSFISTLSVTAGSHPFKINVPNCPEITGYITFSNPSSGGGGSSRHAVLNTGVSSLTSK